MKNQIVIVTILALALSGCSASAAVPAQTTGTQTQTPTAAAGAATAPEAGQDQGGNKPGAEQGKRVRGQIQDILGNEVTLALIEEPKRPEGDAAAAKKPKTTSGDPMGGPPMGGGQSSSVKLTGETKAIQIPVGVPIVSGGPSGGTAMQLSDLATGDILTVMYDTDGTTIIKVNYTAGSSQ